VSCAIGSQGANEAKAFAPPSSLALALWPRLVSAASCREGVDSKPLALKTPRRRECNAGTRSSAGIGVAGKEQSRADCRRLNPRSSHKARSLGAVRTWESYRVPSPRPFLACSFVLLLSGGRGPSVEG